MNDKRNFDNEIDDSICELLRKSETDTNNELAGTLNKLSKQELKAIITIFANMYINKNEELEEIKADIVLRRSQINKDGRPPTPNETIEKIKILKSQNWTTRKIAEYLGISKSTVSNYTKENG